MTATAGSTRTLHARAKDLLNSGDVPAARDLLLRARTAASDAADLARVDGTLAVVDAELGDVAAARERCRAALARDDLDRQAVALLEGQLGYVVLLSGDVDGAVELFSRALDVLTGTERATVLLNRGTAHLVASRLDDAGRDLLEGQDVADPIAAAQCRHNLGYLHLLRGELVDGLRAMDDARATLVDLGLATVATCDIDRSEALVAVGLVPEAVGVLGRTHHALETTDLWRYLADVELRLAGLLDREKGQELARIAAQRFADHGNHAEADRARAVALHARTKSDHPPTREELEDLAGSLDAAGRSESARALRIRSRGLGGELPDPIEENAPLTTRLLAGEVSAEVCLAKGDPAAALRHAGAAVDELEAWQRNIGSLELQDSTFTLGAPLIRLGQQAALAGGDPAVLLEWAERAREVAARGVPSRPPDELGDLLARLRHLGPEGDQDQRAALIEQIRHGRWHAAGTIAPHRALTLDRLRAALGEHRFVSILCIEDEAIALCITGEAVDTLRLGPWQDLAALLGGLAADLAVAAQSASPLVRRGLAERLSAMDAVLAPAFADADAVVLTVPDELAHVPWGQLECLRGVAVTLPLSATAWVGAAEHAAATAAPARVAAVVGPGTETGPVEADGVADAWGEGTLLLPEATCDQVRDLAARVDVLHVCAHGRDRDGHRLFAATELSDGDWFGHDIELLPRVPDIVVLSACGVGGGSLGMARAWLHAGARHVIASPADISETAAAERFPRLHALLADGVSPQRAVAEAFGPDAVDCAVQCYGPSPVDTTR